MTSHPHALGSLLLVVALAGSAPGAVAQDLDQSIQDLSKQLYERLASLKVKKVAVVEFPDLNGYQSTLGQYVAEELLTSLGRSAQPGVFDIVERRMLDRVLQEQQLTATSLFDAESIARVGKILGIEALITGSLTDLDTEVKVRARAISVENASTLAVGDTRFPKTEAVLKLMKQASGPSGGTSLPNVIQPTRSGVQRSDVYFQNGFLRIEVQSASRSENGSHVTLALSLESLTAEDLLIAASASNYGEAFAVIDDRGNASADCAYKGLVRVNPGDEKQDASEYSLLSGKSKTVVTLSCRFLDAVKGQVVAFSGNFARHLGDKDTFFSAGIANIQLAN